MNKEIIKKAQDIVSKEDTVSAFGLVDEDGYPFVSSVVVIKNCGMKEFWISTSPKSRKAELIGKKSKAGLCYREENNNITMMGTAEIVTDPRLKKELWHDWMINFFKGGPADEDYCLIKLTTEKARLCIAGATQIQDFSIGEITESLQ